MSIYVGNTYTQFFETSTCRVHDRYKCVYLNARKVVGPPSSFYTIMHLENDNKSILIQLSFNLENKNKIFHLVELLEDKNSSKPPMVHADFTFVRFQDRIFITESGQGSIENKFCIDTPTDEVLAGLKISLHNL